MAKLGYQNTETPEPIDTKFGMGNYGNMTQQPKFKLIASVGASQQIGEYNSYMFFR